MKSKKYSLNKEDIIKIIKGAGFAVGGSLVVYLLSIFQDIDYGTYSYLIIPIASILLNALNKYLNGK